MNSFGWTLCGTRESWLFLRVAASAFVAHAEVTVICFYVKQIALFMSISSSKPYGFSMHKSKSVLLMIAVEVIEKHCIRNSEDHELTITLVTDLRRLFAFFDECSCRDRDELDMIRRCVRVREERMCVSVHPFIRARIAILIRCNVKTG